MKNIWHNHKGKSHIRTLEVIAWRAVEPQHNSYTRHLVDTEKEHEILESLIEKNKPSLPFNKLQNYHYLLSTPFRYPPLKYGSRFGSIHETSLWYGSKEIETTLSERAFYDFKFLRDTEAQLTPIHKSYTIFSTHVKTKNGVDLTKDPFLSFRDLISSPISYKTSQTLGTHMRKDNVEAFSFFSARDLNDGINIGLFSPRAFLDLEPNHDYQTWEAFIREDSIDFIHHFNNEKRHYNIKQFIPPL